MKPMYSTVYTVTTQNWERIHYGLQKDKVSAEYITSQA